MDKGTCSVEGCERPAMTRGWCSMHYNRWRRNGTTETVRVINYCDQVDCERRVVAEGLCQVHLRRKRLGLDMDAPVRAYRAHTVCSFEGCDEPHQANGWCNYHNVSASRGHELKPILKKIRCMITDCQNLGRWRDGACGQHRARLRYGLSILQIDMIMRSSRCDICQKHLVGADIHIDHDHSCCPGSFSCGQCIRGTLCRECNIGIAAFQDDPDLLRGAHVYLAGK